VTSYAASARLQHVSPHLRDRVWSVPMVANIDADEPAEIVEATDQRLHTLPSLDDLTRIFGETMFFTLDPESWR
jgi:hypothetical protein